MHKYFEIFAYVCCTQHIALVELISRYKSNKKILSNGRKQDISIVAGSIARSSFYVVISNNICLGALYQICYTRYVQRVHKRQTTWQEPLQRTIRWSATIHKTETRREKFAYHQTAHAFYPVRPTNMYSSSARKSCSSSESEKRENHPKHKAQRSPGRDIQLYMQLVFDSMSNALWHHNHMWKTGRIMQIAPNRWIVSTNF